MKRGIAVDLGDGLSVRVKATLSDWCAQRSSLRIKVCHKQAVFRGSRQLHEGAHESFLAICQVFPDLTATRGMDAALKQLRAAYRDANPKSHAAYLDAADKMPGGNTRSTLFTDPFPLIITRGYLNKLQDLDDHEYLDFMSDYTSGIFGKSNPIIKEAIVHALEDVGLQLGALTCREAALAGLIQKRFPSLELLRFCNSGTEANIMALLTAMRFTKRNKVIVFEKAYHGGVLSAFKRNDLPTSTRSPEMNVLQIPFDFLVLPYNDVEAVRRAFSEHASDVAAVLVEPMLGSGGAIPGDPDFLHELRRSTASNQSILIFDEVQTARLAYGGRQSLLQIKPDMTTLGKFFGGGFAIGIFGGRKDIMDMFDNRIPGSIGHGGTFNNSPITMSAGAAALQEVLTIEVMTRMNELGDRLRQDANELFRSNQSPVQMTGLGSINHLHCQDTRLADIIYFELIARGFWIAQRGLVCLSIETRSEHVDRFLKALEQILQKYQRLH